MADGFYHPLDRLGYERYTFGTCRDGLSFCGLSSGYCVPLGYWSPYLRRLVRSGRWPPDLGRSFSTGLSPPPPAVAVGFGVKFLGPPLAIVVPFS